LFIPTTVIGSEDAQMGDVKVVVTPESQGLGGQVTIDIEIPFHGGCCYPLYAYDVSAILKVPETISIVSGPDPPMYKKVEGKPGGEATVVHIKWIITSMIPGTHTISFQVITKNCGEFIGTSTVTFKEGCVMSIPTIYPEFPSTGKDITIHVDAFSPMPGVTVDDVNIYYITTTKFIENTKTDGDTISWFNGSMKKKGDIVSMNRVEGEPYSWIGVIPSQTSTCNLYYWIVAIDSQGNITTSDAYVIKIENLRYANMVVNITIFSVIIGALIGSICIFFVVGKYKTKSDMEPKGLLVIGSRRVISQSDKNLPNRKMCYVVLAILVIVSAIFLIWAFLNNQFQDLIATTRGE
jgi:hypothetical protein